MKPATPAPHWHAEDTAQVIQHWQSSDDGLSQHAAAERLQRYGRNSLPQPAAISLVIREGATLVPDGETRLRAGDQIVVVTTPKEREATERRLRALSRQGRLAGPVGSDDRDQRRKPPVVDHRMSL